MEKVGRMTSISVGAGDGGAIVVVRATGVTKIGKKTMSIGPHQTEMVPAHHPRRLRQGTSTRPSLMRASSSVTPMWTRRRRCSNTSPSLSKWSEPGR